MTEIKLCPAKVLHALAGFANPKDLRPQLRGVWVENSPRGLILHATNGVTLAALRVGERAPCESFDLLLPHAEIKGLPKNDKPVNLRMTPYSLVQYGLGLPWEPDLEMRPVQWRRVTPKDVSHQLAQFDFTQLARFTALAKALGRRNPGVLRLSHNGDGTARVHVPNHPEFVGAITPLRPVCFEAADAWTFNPEWLFDTPPADDAEGLT